MRYQRSIALAMVHLAVMSLVYGCGKSRDPLRDYGLDRSALSHADARDARLDEIILRNTRIRGIDLSNASLKAADLSESDLKGAKLTGADLGPLVTAHGSKKGASPPRRTSLRNANLTGADLKLADLASADLTEAVLRDADLTGTVLSEANLRGADLRRAKAHPRASNPLGGPWRRTGKEPTCGRPTCVRRI